jgi:uncharacterized protein YbcI
MTTTNPTRGQIERTLVQQLHNFYRERIGQRPSQGICQLYDERLSVVLQLAVSPAEQTLLDAGREELVKKVRSELNEAIKNPLKLLIQNIVGTTVIAILIDSDIISGYASITAVLDNTPSVRDPQTIPKVNRKKLAETNPET